MSDCTVALGNLWTCQAIGFLEFLVIMALVFALFMILAGLFTAYFGSGKSRAIGVILFVVGVAVGIFAGYEYHLQSHVLVLLEETVLVLAASVIGALIAIGLFLLAIMKS